MNDRKKDRSAQLILLLTKNLAKLPFKWGVRIGSIIGVLLHFFAAQRRKVTQVNIGLCFPELSAREQSALVKKVFIANGIGLVETAWAHHAKRDMFDSRIEIRNQHFLDEALEQGRGVVLLGAHFSTLDLGGLLFSYTNAPLNTLYRRHNSPVLDAAITKGRAKYGQPIERKNMRKVISSLKDNQCIWFAPDQDLKAKGCVFASFFNHTASTVTATSSFVRFNQSPLLMLAHYRKPDNSGYILEFSQVDSSNSDDKLAFAQVVNDAIERAVRKHPEQYMWMHKRFKTQPDGRHKLYRRDKP